MQQQQQQHGRRLMDLSAIWRLEDVMMMLMTMIEYTQRSIRSL
jgi:hypothetical protein